jgi:hypothetical protein
MGGLVFFLFWLYIPLETGEGYAILTVDEAVPDREIANMLKTAGFHDFYAESETVIFYDDFGRSKSFFLDELSGTFESFDPRNSGYDQTLRSFFVQDEMRRFFIPLGEDVRPWQTEKVMRNIMGSVPYTLDVLFRGRNIAIWFLFQSAAVLAALILSREKLSFIPLIPVIVCFAWGSLSGLILSCVLIGIWELLYEPLKELFAHKPYGSIKYRLKAYRSSIVWAALFVVVYAFLVRAGTVPAIPAWVGFGGVLFIQTLSFLEAKIARARRRSFTPVLMLSIGPKPRAFCVSMTASTLVTLVAFALVMLMPSLFFHKNDQTSDYLANLPAASDYEAHMAFQSSFSFMPLGRGSGQYMEYILGEDGLIAGIFESDIKNQWEIPVFPLERLIEFLIQYTERPGVNPLPGQKDWISMGLIILACAPFRHRAKSMGKKNKNLLARYSGVAA